MTRSDDARERIRADILSGALPFGARLTLKFLSDRYATSHTPIREALRDLNGEGLVILEPNQGSRVRAVDAEFIEVLFEIRVALESLIARRAAERIGEDGIAALRGAQAELEAHADAGRMQEVVVANRRFHSIIQEAARSDYASELAQLHWPLLGALWRQFGYSKERLSGVISDHRQLIQVLEERDAAATGALAGAHVVKAKVALLRAMRAQPEGGSL